MKGRLGTIREDERGVFLIILVLSMSVLFGFLALTIDVGGVLTMRRVLVRAADAAALAGAQACANDESAAAVTSAVNEYASLNLNNASGLTVTNSGCGLNNKITVTLTKSKSLDFAPLIGGPGSRGVSAQGIAQWGGALAGPPEPFGLSSEIWAGCFVPSPVNGTQCTFSATNNDTSSQWGGLDLLNWGPNPDCQGDPGNTPGDWVPEGFRQEGVGPVPLPVDPSVPTYVCGDSGLNRPIWEKLNLGFPDGALSTTQIFAVLGEEGYDKDLDRYRVVGLTKLKVIGAQKVGDEFLITLEWVGFQLTPGPPGTPTDFGLASIALVPN